MTRARRPKRRPDEGWPPSVRLATRIVELAIHDWQRPTRVAREAAEELGFKSVREEVEAFLESAWCKELLKYLDLDLDLLALLRQADEDAP